MHMAASVMRKAVIAVLFSLSFFYAVPTYAGTYGSSAYGDSLYSTGSADSTAPILSGGAPSSILGSTTTSLTLSLETDENATCRYSTSAGIAYASIPNTFTTTGTTSHSTDIVGLSSNNDYTYYVRCIDTSSNANTSDYIISFNIERRSGSSVSTPVSVSSLPSNPYTPAPYMFDRTILYGQRTDAVVQLQRYLNTHGYPVTSIGLGSLGYETDFLGPLTRAALRKFQFAHGILPTGNLGPLTRRAINANTEPASTGIVTAINLNVRSTPGGNAIISVVPQGTVGTILSAVGSWLHMRFTTTIQGFVYNQFIKLQSGTH